MDGHYAVAHRQHIYLCNDVTERKLIAGNQYQNHRC